MCFTGEMSAAFAAIGLFSAWWVYTRTNNIELASGIFFFFTMEFLQAIQYYFIAPELVEDEPGCPSAVTREASPCDSYANKILTLLGFLHICLQPYYCHVINASLTKSCKYKGKNILSNAVINIFITNQLFGYRSLSYCQAFVLDWWIFVIHQILPFFCSKFEHYGCF